MSSTHAVSVVKRLFQAKRAGHAGTLDPLASGLLPIALGEATKTVPFVMEGRKVYRFTVRWGEERDTDDAEGRVTESSTERPSAAAVGALLPRFTGQITQAPPRFSAVKIAGERAYDLPRDGEVVDIAPRPVEIHRLELIETPDRDHAPLVAECGKGTYVRALARDPGRALKGPWPVAAPRPPAGRPPEPGGIATDRLRRGRRGRASGPPAGRGRLGGAAGAAGEPRRRRAARARAGGAAARARCARHRRLGVGLLPRLADRAGGGR